MNIHKREIDRYLANTNRKKNMYYILNKSAAFDYPSSLHNSLRNTNKQNKTDHLENVLSQVRVPSADQRVRRPLAIT